MMESFTKGQSWQSSVGGWQTKTEVKGRRSVKTGHEISNLKQNAKVGSRQQKQDLKPNLRLEPG